MIRTITLALALSVAASAQPAAVSGTVEDGQGRPLPGASVYLSGTTFGAPAGPGGRFEISGVPPGAYRLVGSMVGFAPSSRPLRLDPGQETSVGLTLVETVSDLDGVHVEVERDRRWERRLAQFRHALIGESANADSTRILNPEVLSFRQRWGTLRAEAAAPLVIENRALGYRLTYDLTRFSAGTSYIDYDGEEHFQELAPADSAQADRWRDARASAWRGSLTHLLQSLLAGTAERNGYSFEQMDGDRLSRHVPRRTSASRLMAVDEDGWGRLRVRGRLLVTYTGEPEEDRYLASDWFQERRGQPEPVQRSSIRLRGLTVRVDPQGTLEDPSAVITSGYMAFERLADLVPEDYRPGPPR